MAADSEADLLVSIHGNTASKASAFGARVYYSDRRGDSRSYANAVAAAIDQNGASRKITTVHLDNGLAMVNSVGMPSVLVETCFLTNTEDAEQALTEEWINNMAKSIVDGICKEFPCETTFQ
jgi:N-acetylmuramoyl-L-alanine amidase